MTQSSSEAGVHGNRPTGQERARVLVVDDELQCIASLRRILARSGFEVVGALGGRQALRSVSRCRPDLILLDVHMPTMSGYEVLRRLRRLERRGLVPSRDKRAQGPIPVLFLTASGTTRERVSGLDAGAVDYIIKPFDADELRARLRRCLHWARDCSASTATNTAGEPGTLALEETGPWDEGDWRMALAALEEHLVQTLAGCAEQCDLQDFKDLAIVVSDRLRRLVAACDETLIVKREDVANA